MIAVAGFNSAIDTVADADAIRAGDVVRLSAVEAFPGGKGVHVAQTCATTLTDGIGAHVALVGLIDRAHAALFARVLEARGVDFRGVAIGERLRTCYAIRDARGTITELLEPGPTIDAAIVCQLEETFLGVCEDATVAVLSGSLPAGCPPDLYARLVTRLRDRVSAVIVDASGAALAHAIAAGPTFVKPNRAEAARLLGHAIVTAPDACQAVRAIVRRGARGAIVSLGDEGAVVAWDGRVARVAVPPQVAINAVGSGDAFVGGLAVALSRGAAPDDALRLAAACGAANVLTREPGRCDRADLDRLMADVRIAWLS